MFSSRFFVCSVMVLLLASKSWSANCWWRDQIPCEDLVEVGPYESSCTAPCSEDPENPGEGVCPTLVATDVDESEDVQGRTETQLIGDGYEDWVVGNEDIVCSQTRSCSTACTEPEIGGPEFGSCQYLPFTEWEDDEIYQDFLVVSGSDTCGGYPY